MNTCDLKVIEVILGFSMGGVGLRVAISLVVKWMGKKLNIKGFPTLLITFVMCALAVLAYMALTEFVWMCFLFWTSLLFAGTQTAYRLSHKKS